MAALAAAVLAGALTQRISGIGFALVAAPVLILLLGPVQGVVVTNVFAVLTALSVYIRHARDVEYRKILPLLLAACVAAVPCALLTRDLPADVLAVIAGCLVLGALALSVTAQRVRGIAGRPGLIAAGALSGAMNVAAGVGGPAVAAYAVAARWPHDRFALSVQFYFVVLGVWSLLVRGVPPALTPTEWAVAVLALAAGLWVGSAASRRVGVRAARRWCLVVAFLGALGVVAQGVLGLAA
ncbi:TSUP family transporter [Agromyces silvae]|uniref:TSUP family transporter n=1 Tax=Agromyces silvae TaxID=3388266 RepID=UPI00280B7250|nr:TSUP family transporter [Agromyces protaetiae]